MYKGTKTQKWEREALQKHKHTPTLTYGHIMTCLQNNMFTLHHVTYELPNCHQMIFLSKFSQSK